MYLKSNKHDHHWVIKQFLHARNQPEFRQECDVLMTRLSRQEQKVMAWSHGLGTASLSVDEIARQLEIKPGRVHQLHRDAVRRLSEMTEFKAIVEQHLEQLRLVSIKGEATTSMIPVG